MKIMFVLNSLGAGGTERSTAQLLPALRARGVEVVVVTLGRAAEGDEEQVRGEFPVYVLNSRRLAPRIVELRRLVRETRPDVVHTAIFEADLIGRLAGYRTGVPVVSSLVNTSYDRVRLTDPRVRPSRLRAAKAIDSFTARHLVARLHAVSEGVAAANIETLGLDPERVEVVERGRDWSAFGTRSPERRARVRDGLGVAPEAVLVLSVGRHEFQKAHTDLVTAAELLAERRADVVVLVAGRDGNASAELRRRLATSSAGGRVRLLGHRTDVPDLLAAADVFAMPSVYEGTAGAALEAMAMGVPVVATSVDGVRGILEHRRNALLVPVRRPDLLAGAIDEVINDTGLRDQLFKAGLDDIASRFTIEHSADRMIELYRRALATPAGRAGAGSLLDAVRARVPMHVRHRIAQVRVEARTPTGRRRRLPDALVIGAQRCGTSTLYRHLGRHPDVAPSVRKEVEYFSRRYGRGERWYRAHFALAVGRRRLAFEATPDYLFHPLAAARAADTVPDARLVVMLRDPVARGWSHYHHMVALGHEPLDLEAALAAEDDRCAADLARLQQDPLHDPRDLLRYSYIARGRYAEQLTRWLDHFPRERLLVVRSEDFFADPAPTFRRIIEFLGLPPWEPEGFVNVSRRNREAPTPMPESSRAALAECFEPENERLVSLLGATAPRW